jgi:hypothetical protein
LAEERAFLKDYTVPFVQLDPMKVILVFSHEHNTFDKRKLLVNANPDVVRDSPKKVMDFIKDNALRRFYMSDLEKLLEDYAPGRPEMKPDVIAQTLKLEKERAKMAEDAAAAGGGGNIVLQQDGQPPITLNNQQVVQILQNLQMEVDAQKKEIERLKYENAILNHKYETLRKEHLVIPTAATADTDATDATAAVSAESANNIDAEPETIYV